MHQANPGIAYRIKKIPEGNQIELSAFGLFVGDVLSIQTKAILKGGVMCKKEQSILTIAHVLAQKIEVERV